MSRQAFEAWCKDHHAVDWAIDLAWLAWQAATNAALERAAQDPALREPLHTVTTKDRFGLVTVQGEQYQIADIGLRMLTPRELYRAQGFPDSYIIDHGADGRALTKTAQVRMCGNSVSPYCSRAIVGANYRATELMREAA